MNTLNKSAGMTTPIAHIAAHSIFMQKRIRAAMAAAEMHLLQGMVEADETYIGGKPRKGKIRSKNKELPPPPPPNNPRDRGTRKTPVIGAVERGGKAVARAADGTGDLTGQGILRFLKTTIDPVGSLLITDEYTAYQVASPLYGRAVIKHKERYADGHTHTNTIEGFWSLIKRAWYGSHHHYSRNNFRMTLDQGRGMALASYGTFRQLSRSNR